MDYYKCPTHDLYSETQRRSLPPLSRNREQLNEDLVQDDIDRGSDATTIRTVDRSTLLPQTTRSAHAGEIGNTIVASQLVNEKIVYWTLNTFFPTLHLFFESGRSCVIDGGRLSDAFVGLDPALRFKLTDCAHEEEGRVSNSILPERFSDSGIGLVIQEAVVSQRTSIAVKNSQQWAPRDPPQFRIVTEMHTVIGLRLRGMNKMAFIWARTKAPSGGRLWGDIRLTLSDKCLEPSSYNNLQLNIIMPGATAIVLYPRKEGSTFDKEYYLKTHMPLAMKHWGPHGMKSYAVSELGADGPYSISSVMEFDSQEAVGKAMQDPGTKEIMDDVKNFTNSEPILVHGSIIGTS
ncbi:hypothetical protein GT037_006676 [Alternaria burnsii]|uniref:EthD domain-containing protein n=1 Tax=Alternaria burnsii TaxID=1187904 RepID=A0A8H7B3Z8_9PLEO|nr:uncharacterized protein GT037_006676 [Alternaria burnsii]KAF7674913.1 hypothetical protein GT037_006676 [Alternaria burnsii]